MTKYRKKPVEVVAHQWDGTAEGAFPIIQWIRDNGDIAYFRKEDEGGPGLSAAEIGVYTLEGRKMAYQGDWIIRGVAGDFYPCRADIFEQTYEPVEEQSNDQ